GARLPHPVGDLLKPAQRVDLCPQLRNGQRRSRAVQHLFLNSLGFLSRHILQVAEVLIVILRAELKEVCLLARGLCLLQPRRQALPPPPQRLEDGLGRGCQPPLQDGQREANRAPPLLVEI